MKAGILALAIAFALPAAARGQGAVTISDHALYRDVDRLIDTGLVDSAIVGQRPYSRLVLARIVGEASTRLESRAATDAIRLTLGRNALNRVRRHIGTGPIARTEGSLPRWSLLHSLHLEALATDAPARSVPDNGVGTIEADLNTLTNYRQGRRLATGSNVSLESDHWVELPGRVSLQARPRLWAYAQRGGTPGDASIELLAGSARVVRGNVALTVGREYTVWSPTADAGLFFSENAPGLDMIRLASDAPFVLPSVFRHLGAIAATIQLADVGRSTSNSHSRLVAYKVSAKPARTLEVSGTFMNHFGGAGARNPSVSARIFDLLPFVDVFRKHADSTDFDSDKLLGLDGRLRLPKLANITLFGEMALEDFDYHRLGSILTEDAAYTVGVIIPELFVPVLSARVSYHVTGIRFYEHHLVKNGIAANRFTLGDDLGRDAAGVYGSLRWERHGGVSLAVDGAFEERRNDEYLGSYTNPELTGLVFRRVSTAPREGRRRGMLSARWYPSVGRVALEARAGAEQVTNFGFSPSPAQLRGVASVGMRAFPGP